MLAEAYRAASADADRRRAAIRLDAAGYLSARARALSRGRAARVSATAGLAGEFTYHGAVDRDGKLAFLRTLDVLSVPATYDEPKGVFLLEAMASGVPVVQPRRGAFTEIVEKTGGGLLVAPDDPARWPTGCTRCGRTARSPTTLGARGFAGVRAHYSIAHVGRSACSRCTSRWCAADASADARLTQHVASRRLADASRDPRQVARALTCFDG